MLIRIKYAYRNHPKDKKRRYLCLVLANKNQTGRIFLVLEWMAMMSIDIFPWNDNFNTGVQTIDEQHKKLVQLLNSLASHIAFQSDIPALNVIFDELIDYTVYHFQAEEVIWHQYFPEDPSEIKHKAVHNSFIETVLKLRADENTKPADSVIEEVLAFLTRWLASHILESDRYFAMVVLAMQSGMALESAKKQANEQMGGSTRALIYLTRSRLRIF